jgi:hypothetical protein
VHGELVASLQAKGKLPKQHTTASEYKVRNISRLYAQSTKKHKKGEVLPLGKSSYSAVAGVGSAAPWQYCSSTSIMQLTQLACCLLSCRRRHTATQQSASSL